MRDRKFTPASARPLPIVESPDLVRARFRNIVRVIDGGKAHTTNPGRSRGRGKGGGLEGDTAMTASTATRMPDATGTSFAPKPGRPFMTRYPGSGDIRFESVHEVDGRARVALRENNTKALEKIGRELLSEPVFVDPDIRYARGVLVSILDEVRAEGSFTSSTSSELDEYDAVLNAFDIAVERAAHVVAAAWLRERGSIPIPSER